MNFTHLDEFLDCYLPMLGVPGSDTVIYKNHQQIYRHTSGFDSLKFRTPLRPDALYNVYSCTKIATVVAILGLVERGELVVTDPLYAYMPEYRDVAVKIKDECGNTVGTERAKNPILIKHLLTMTSGMNYDLRSPSILKTIGATNGAAPTLDICRSLANEPLEFEPGQDFLYGLSLDICGGLVELISGMRFSDYMKETIFDPLGMNDTHYHIPQDKAHRMATEYDFDARTKCGIERPVTDCAYRFGYQYDSAGAGIVSSVEDQILLFDALASGGIGKSGERILSPASVNLMSKNMLNEKQLKTFAINHNTGYGYGYGVRVNIDPISAGNLAPEGAFGWNGAKMCYTVMDPKSGISVFHAEHMDGLLSVAIPRLCNALFSALSE